MKKMNKKLHQWAQENNCHVWELRKKLFWQNTNEKNATYKVTENLMVTFNGLMLIQGSAYEMYDATKQITVLVTEHGIFIEENKDDTWQMYRR